MKFSEGERKGMTVENTMSVYLTTTPKRLMVYTGKVNM